MEVLIDHCPTLYMDLNAGDMKMYTYLMHTVSLASTVCINTTKWITIKLTIFDILINSVQFAIHTHWIYVK